ncbi:MAG TPA: lactate utilization protein [Phycisphaerae bacterium]|nr:lactate utilization protein [Phycisphaerae bacterium]
MQQDRSMMLGESQEEFLKRVRTALSDRGAPVDLPEEHEIARIIDSGRDIVSEFAQRAEQAKMTTCRVQDEDALLDKIAEIARQLGATSAVVPDDGLPARDRIVARLEQENLRVLDADDREAAFSADLGITGVTSAIAETASLCLTSGGGRRRLASLAVPVHIAVVRAEQIVPDLLDWAAQQTAEPPANQTLVSAPSKTADIELALVMGVHGPKQEYVIILG